MANGYAFVSHDGQDDDGIRAEVYVQKGKGVVSNLKPHKNEKVAQVGITTEGLRFEQNSWVNVNSDLYAIATKAYDSGEEVEYRIESQRRPGIKRDIPIEELRKDTKTSQESTKSILAGLNGVMSDEAVTHPSEDGRAGGRFPAQPRNETPAAPAQNTHNVPGSRSAKEAPSYLPVNDDGSRNLGSYAIQGAAGVEAFVRNQLVVNGWSAQNEDFESEVFGFSAAVLSIVDPLQHWFTKKNVDRIAGSHARLRGVIFDTIEHYVPFSLIREGFLTRDAWFSRVGSLTRSRFDLILELDSPEKSQFNLNQFLGREEKKAEARTEVPAESANADAEAESVRPTARRVVEDNPAQDTPAEEAHADAAEEQDEQANLDALKKFSTNDFMIWPAHHTEKYEGDDNADVVDQIKELVADTEVDAKAFGRLINYTFNQRLVMNVEPALLEEFFDFYLEAETTSPGNLAKVIEHVKKSA